jgi:ketosteroid isomerase-like protein
LRDRQDEKSTLHDETETPLMAKPTNLRMTIKPDDGAATRRSGFTLTILRKEIDGRWKLARDANLLTEESESS